MIMEDYQKRVLKEKEDLDERITSLRSFLNSDKCPKTCGQQQFILMRIQLSAMNEYSDVLRQRIEAFS